RQKKVFPLYFGCRSIGFDTNAIPFGIYIGKLGSKKNKKTRIRDPKQYYNNVSGSTIGRTKISFAKINAQEQFSYDKEYSRDYGSDPDCLPLNFGIGQIFEHNGKQ